MGYSMTADETQFWQDQAALLDPLAYEHVFATSTTRTVPGGERYYLLNGWQLDDGSSGLWYHRPADVNRALIIPSGESVITSSSAGSFMWLCKPSLVTGSDARYTTDPRGLYFDRLAQLGTLTTYRLAGSATGAGSTAVTFPTDFTYGMVVHVSVHDVAWMIMTDSGASNGLSNTHNEISDTHGIRWAEPLLFPFTRTTMPKMLIQGVSLGSGRASTKYIKLPGGW
jgi:hypothetical protein